MTDRKVFYYKGVQVNAYGIPTFLLGGKEDKLKRRNRERRFYYSSFVSPFTMRSPKNLIVMYDIPSKKKQERDWLRRQLIRFDYIMIQKSVWVGPSPLPKEFLFYVKEIGINNKLKTFKLLKGYTAKEGVL